MSFDLLFALGAATLLVGWVAAIACYLQLQRRARPERMPSFTHYFGLATGIGLGAYALGAALGVGIACAPDDSGDLCGVYGVLGSGPLLAGTALTAYGLLRSRRVLVG
jgi:hypothetical protein